MKQMKIIIGFNKEGDAIYCGTANSHITIVGCSGMGKTTLNYILIAQLLSQGIPVVAVDVGGSFQGKRFHSIMDKYVHENIMIFDLNDIPVNPFILKEYRIDDRIYVENITMAASRLSDILKMTLKLGSQQYVCIFNALKAMFEKKELDINLESLYENLCKGKGPSLTTANKLLPIKESIKFWSENENLWPEILNNDSPKFTVIQLSNLDRITQRITVDFILEDIKNYISVYGMVEKPFVLVLDEIQKVNTALDSPISELLLESRKYGAGIICSTQNIRVKGNKDIAAQFEQAATKVYFRPCESEINALARQLSNGSSSDWKSIIRSMKEFCCIVENGREARKHNMCAIIKDTEEYFDNILKYSSDNAL